MKAKVLKARIKLLRELFVSRDDAYIECRNGKFTAVHEYLSDEVLTDHLAGIRRIGTYFLRRNKCLTQKMTFDVDKKSRKRVKRIVKRLRTCGAFPYVERSKSKGFHIWVFFDKPLKAVRAQLFAQIILRGLDASKIEIFPKQRQGTKLGFGLALPLFGSDIPKHRTVFLDSDFNPILNQTAYLRAINRTPRTAIFTVLKNDSSKSSEYNSPNKGPVPDLSGQKIPEGERNTTLTSIAGTMRNKGVDAQTIFLALTQVNRIQCDPPLEDKEVASIAESVSRYEPGQKSVGRGGSASAELVKLANDATFFHTPQNEAFAEITVNNHQEIRRLKDKSFKAWLANLFYQRFRTTPSTQAMTDAFGVLEGQALYGKSLERTVFTRVGEHEGSIVLDLANEPWAAVVIKSNNWNVVSKPPIAFRRAQGMQELPVPEHGGSIEELRPFLNVDDDGFTLIVGWLIGTLHPRGPYPPLILQGEAGSAKSTTCRVLRSLIDPNIAPLRPQITRTQDLMISATNSWCIAFDNLSGLSDSLSDNLCCLATGAGFSTRQLYSDDEEKIFQATRPILLNGIDGTATRGDLLDRSIIVYLSNIRDRKRKLESEFWQKFNLARPRILGAILTAESKALARCDKVKLEKPPRMADFAKWVTAAEPALRWPDGIFAKIYNDNRRAANRIALESSPIMPALEKLFEKKLEWIGTASQLLSKLHNCKPPEKNDRYFPQYPKTLSMQLRKIAPNLRAEGFGVEFDIKTPGEDSKRLIRLRNPNFKNLKWMKRFLRRVRR